LSARLDVSHPTRCPPPIEGSSAMLSIVIPVYNEEESLETLHGELDAVGQANDYQLDIVFVDDGSSDSSWDVVERLAEKDPRVRGIRFRRNFGKAAALDAGFSAARGEIVFTLDADLQDDPKEIPRFLAKMDEGFGVVSGWKQVRHDPWHKVGPSRVFNAMVSWLTGVKLHDHNCGFKCYKREIFDEVQLYGELHRFVPVLAAARGWNASEIVVDHRERQFGQSKYGVRRIVKGFLDLLTVKFITGYGQRPQHLLGTIGLICFGLGFLGMFLLSAMWVISRCFEGIDNVHLHERAIFYYAGATLLLGAQITLVGFLAEMITANHMKSGDAYSIAKTVGSEPGTNDKTS
jgi:glycosyltransferase involved in cell wall biosynthesis